MEKGPIRSNAYFPEWKPAFSQGENVVGEEFRTMVYPRANGAKRRSGCKPDAKVTNSVRLFTPGEKDSIADSKVGVIVGLVVFSLISKICRCLSGVEKAKIHI